MGKKIDSLTPELTEFIKEQKPASWRLATLVIGDEAVEFMEGFNTWAVAALAKKSAKQSGAAQV